MTDVKEERSIVRGFTSSWDDRSVTVGRYLNTGTYYIRLTNGDSETKFALSQEAAKRLRALLVLVEKMDLNADAVDLTWQGTHTGEQDGTPR